MKTVLLVNDPMEKFGGPNIIREFLLAEFPDMGPWFEYHGGARSWAIDEITKMAERIRTKLLAIVISDALGRELVAKTAALGIRQGVPVIVIGNDVSVHTIAKPHGNGLAPRLSVTGDASLDIPVDRLHFKYSRTTNLIEMEARIGRIYLISDLVRLGRRGLAKIEGMGKTTIADVADTLEKQFEVRLE